MPVENVVETDVLVIGGGIAGCFAAIKAKEQGVDVTLVDKGYVGKSGQTPFAHFWSVFNPEWGHKLDDWMDQANTRGEYINNREWTEIVFKDSYAIYQDLISWGVEFIKEDGKLLRKRLGALETLVSEDIGFAQLLRKQAVKSGARVMDRIMATDLLKQDGKVVGAICIPMDSYDLHIFKAKAIVISTGASSFKPAGWPVAELTGDGDAMAYRVGAEVTGKEFVDTHAGRADFPAFGGHAGSINIRRSPGNLDFINAEGDEVAMASRLSMEFEAHAGRAPVFMPISNLVSVIKAVDKGQRRQQVDVEAERAGLIRFIGGTSAGMSVHKAEGIWPINIKCATSLPGLYAAGDSCGTMQAGARYGIFGTALLGSAATGARAGVGAAEYALQTQNPIVDKKELARLKKIVYAPTERKGGFSPRWVTQVLQNTMIPYFIMYIKHGDRMQAALTIVEFLRDHLVPKLTAKDPHELRLAHETKNMVLNAEMKLRASLLRTESRGCHYREDYPRRDDPAWLAWVLLKDEGGQMKAFKKPMPEEWRPDLSKPYKERYPARFPGE